MTTVLLVDDQDLVRAGLRVILQSEPGVTVVGEAPDGAEGVRLARELDPDVICMDVQMPRMDGLEATRLLVGDPAHPPIRAGVIVLTTFDRDDYLFEALRAGASGFLLKTASPEQLIEAVQTVARGDALLSPAVTRRVIERFAAPGAAGAAPGDLEAATHPGDAGRHPGASSSASEPVRRPGSDPAGAGDAAAVLTEREREVLTLLTRGLSNAEIAARLYVGEATVKTHVSRILMKLEVRDRIHAVVFAYEHGLAVPGEAQG